MTDELESMSLRELLERQRRLLLRGLTAEAQAVIARARERFGDAAVDQAWDAVMALSRAKPR
jgi:hypothetical protein